jgi:hypoxanthine phosphoribosyltransferase
VTAAPARPAGRVFAHQQIWRLTPESFRTGADVLAAAVPAAIGPVAAVVGVAAGGLVLADALAARLEVPRLVVRARHNTTDAIYEPATGDVTCDLSGMPCGPGAHHISGPVLIADDICGSGATLRCVRAALLAHLDVDVTLHAVVLCRNTGADHDPDLWLWDVSDWVVFPWEPPPTRAVMLPLPTPTAVRTSCR